MVEKVYFLQPKKIMNVYINIHSTKYILEMNKYILFKFMHGASERKKFTYVSYERGDVRYRKNSQPASQHAIEYNKKFKSS